MQMAPGSCRAGHQVWTRNRTMSVIHQQAMNYVYQQVLTRLLGSLTPGQRAAVQLLIPRLILASGGMQRLPEYKVMTVLEPGTACLTSLALLRAAQLTLAARNQPTFRIRVVICSQAGLDQASLGNIQRCCNALFVHDDPRIELLLLDEERITTCDPGDICAAAVGVAVQRVELLMGVHVGQADLPQALLIHTYLALAHFYRRLLTWKGGADAIIVDHSPLQRRRFIAWSLRALRSAGLASPARSHWQASTCLRVFEGISRSLGRPLGGPPPGRTRYSGDPCIARFICMHDLIQEPSAPGSALLAFLGCECDEPIFSLGEIWYPQTVLLSHLHGLRAQHLDLAGYETGVENYLRNVQGALLGRDVEQGRTKQRPALSGRARAEAFVLANYGLAENQLTCLVFAPFVNQGAGLERYLRACYPGMLVAMPYLHRALQGASVPEQVLQWLRENTGLPLAALQNLYQTRGAS